MKIISRYGNTTEYDKFAQNHGEIMELYKNIIMETSQKINLLGNMNVNLRYVSDQQISSCNDILSVRMRVNRVSQKMSSQAVEIIDPVYLVTLYYGSFNGLPVPMGSPPTAVFLRVIIYPFPISIPSHSMVKCI